MMERYGEVINLREQSLSESEDRRQHIYQDSLIIDDNTVYEIDLECIQRKKKRNK